MKAKQNQKVFGQPSHKMEILPQNILHSALSDDYVLVASSSQTWVLFLSCLQKCRCKNLGFHRPIKTCFGLHSTHMRGYIICNIDDGPDFHKKKLVHRDATNRQDKPDSIKPDLGKMNQILGWLGRLPARTWSGAGD